MVRRQPQVPMAESNTPLDSNAVVDFLGGGLNSMSSSLNVPRGDSPYLVNMDTTDKGNVAGRGGSRYQARFEEDVVPRGAVVVPFISKTGTTYSLIKIGDDAYLFESTYDSIKNRMDFERRLTFSSCFATNSALIQPDSVVITEEDIRVLFTFGVSAPVQFRIIERQTIKNPVSSFTTTTFTGTDLEFADIATVLFKVDGENFAVSAVNYAAGVLTVTHPSLPAGEYITDLVFITWQWMCQGYLMEGKDLYQMETRFSAAQTDISLPIPVDLIKANVPLDDARYLWPIIPYITTNRASYYTYKADLKPNTENEFSFSNGLAYVPATADAVVPGISHTTFGALGTGIKEVHYVKALRLEFDGDAPSYPVTTHPVKVFVNGSIVTNYVTNTSTDTVGRAVYLRNIPGTKAQFYSDTSLAGLNYKYLSFDAAPTVGIDYTAVVEIIFPYINAAFVGGNAVNEFSQAPRLGRAYPLYGVQEHANYALGSFPRTCHLFQGRLFFGGLPSEPTKVFCTEVVGTAINGDKYSNVSNDYSNILATDPISFIIASSEKGAAISAMADAAGSLIVFSQANSYRVFSSSALSPTNFSVSTVAAVGCVNSHSVVSVSNSVTFLSLSGVYRLSPALQVGDFDISLLSIKINNLLKQKRNSEVSWMFYDDIENRLYLGVTDSPTAWVVNRMFVYAVQWEAWTEYALYTGYFTAVHGAPIKLNRSYQVFLTCFDFEQRSAQTLFIISTGERDLATDFTLDNTNWGAAVAEGFNSLPFVHCRKVLASADPYINLKTFRLVEFPDVRDATVMLNNVVIQGWKKLSSTLIQLTERIAAEDIVEVHPKNDLGDYPILLYKDNVLPEYTVNVDPDTDLATVDFDVAPSPLSVFKLALSIPYAYATGVFTRSNLTGDKQFVDLFALMYNADYQARFSGTDVNTAVDQNPDELIGIFKTPVGVTLGRYVNGIDYAAAAENANPNIQFDLDRSDVGGLQRQVQTYARIGAALKGSEDVVQGYAYTFGFRVFCITAYQLVAKSIGRSTK